MGLAVGTAWLVVVSLDDVRIFNPVHDVGGASETGDDTVAAGIIPNDGSAIIEVVFKDLQVGELGLTWLSVIGVESPLLNVGSLLDLVFLYGRSGGGIAGIVDLVSFVLDIRPGGTGI